MSRAKDGEGRDERRGTRRRRRAEERRGEVRKGRTIITVRSNSRKGQSPEIVHDIFNLIETLPLADLDQTENVTQQ